LSNQTLVSKERIDDSPVILRTDGLLERLSVLSFAVYTIDFLILRFICVERLLFDR